MYLCFQGKCFLFTMSKTLSMRGVDVSMAYGVVSIRIGEGHASGVMAGTRGRCCLHA